MLQALGVNQCFLDRQTRERRLIRFWHLALLSKGLAIIFGRTPTFHRKMVKEIGLPTLEQIQLFRPHLTQPVHLGSSERTTCTRKFYSRI